MDTSSSSLTNSTRGATTPTSTASSVLGGGGGHVSTNGMRPRSSGSRPVSAGSVGSTGSGSDLMPQTPPANAAPPPPMPPGPVVVVTVIKDSGGYGMKVSGDNPVYVQSVKPSGAAERAGLRQGDKILKVNGVTVTHSTHVEVVDLIRADAQVVLTVQQRSSCTPPRPTTMPSSPPGGGAPTPSRHLHHHHVSAPGGIGKSSRDSITGPQPVDLERQRLLETNRKHTFRLMLEKDLRFLEALRSELAKSNDPRVAQELTKAERRVRILQEQLQGLESATSPTPTEFYQTQSQSAYFSVGGTTTSPPPLPPSRPRTLPPQPSSPGSPPALPPRNPIPPLVNPTPTPDAAGTDLNDKTAQSPLSPTTNRYANPTTPTHQRTKSSPDPLGNATPSVEGRLTALSGSESVQDLSFTNAGRREKGMSSSWDVDSPRITPPGTPPPPYRGGSIGATSCDLNSPAEEHKNGATAEEGGASSPDANLGNAAFNSTIQQPIISMEDDEMSDQEMGQMEDHGPFKSLSKLWQHSAHLAVFMNYVLSNCDPSSLLFFLVTDLYKEGNAKEMKKWAYEIHSSFLVPGAPLRLSNVDETIAREVDEVLLREYDKEEILRKVFWKPRSKAKEELTEQLADFRQKRVAGLGTLFGPPDAQLEESIHDKSKEARIIENLLLPKVEPCLEEFEREVDVRREADVRRGTLCAAVCTITSKLFNVRSSHLLERIPTFVSKDKSLKHKLLGRSRKLTVQGHQLVAHQYYAVTYCNHCGLIIGGIGPQGYQCTSCLLNIHRWCVRTLEESCAGPLVKKDKGNDRISKLMERIRPEREARRKPSNLNASHLEKVKKGSEERDEVDLDNFGERTGASAANRRGGVDALREGNEDRGADSSNMDHNHLDSGSPLQPPLPVLGNRKPSATSINRSESYKERVQKRQLRERRKTSDPNLSKSTDVDADGTGLYNNNNSGSSSNSTQSLRSLDSPSNSLEMVTGVASRVPENLLPALSSAGGGLIDTWDSDMDSEPDPPDWTRNVSEAELKQLTSREKKRQEVINELFHTERSHVRALKVLDQVFYRPLLEAHILPYEQVMLLFPNLTEMLEIHSGFNNTMKAKRLENPIVGEISELLLNMFDGPAGENFQREAATFCAKQQLALEALKERRRKDQKLNSFLADAEGNPVCRRLQLKDIIPTGMLRLTKYPLLFENLVKLCEPGSEERAGVQRSLDRSKEILNHVNQAVREAEDFHRLADIHKKLDKAQFDKAEHPMVAEFKHLDLTKHRLVYEGALSWRQSKGQKPIELHVLLLEELIMLIQKSDDKFVLKFHSVNTSGGQDSKLMYSPIIKFNTVLVRPVATDKKAFFLVNTSQSGAQIYELVAFSSSERKTWFRHISEAADAYKMREGRARRPDIIPPTLSASPAEGSSNTTTLVEEKDNVEASTSSDQAGASSTPTPAAPAAPESTDSGFQEGNAEAAPSPSSALPSDSSPDDANKKSGASPGLMRRSSSSRGSCEVTRLTEETPLINPSEVVVCRRDVLLAEPVLTPIERLRREDEAIAQALMKKQEIVAELLHIPRDQFETIAELASEPTAEKEASEIALACFHQASRLTNLLNESLRVSEEEAVSAGASPSSPRPGRHRAANKQLPAVPSHMLQDLCSSLNTHITQMMRVAKERDEERELMRRETQRLREQVHAMHEQRRSQHGSTRPKRRATATGMSSTTFATVEPDAVSNSSEKTGDDCDSLTDQPPDTEPSQEEFVDALCGEGEGSSASGTQQLAGLDQNQPASHNK